ncbi:peptidylprolyl isomerase [Mesonia mobilis]|uniref:Peptidyl-prolyl cis-trans isomerase n=1 Tax=Mesonia mobilis TaxID=369791 RepID=A0ABQ3BMB5_9FLAO|nr:peptidylprolyl isomerase [Mesonia mobilis]MBQ0739169.1 peptidylprolyl isomerase [Aquimarina celericrescens]GGZ51591.1 peptidyl-prolyl cis-trans isomerase [Mesonia mobilis]
MSYFQKLVSFTFVITILFASCEDTKTNSSSKQTQKELQQKKQKVKQDSIINSINIPDGGSKTDIDLRSITTVEQEQLIPFLTKYGKENPEDQVTIYTNFGEIDVKLYKDTPLHRANFIRLAKIGYFETTFFHRVLDNFVVQGGNSDNLSTQKVRAAVGDYLIPSEFSSKHQHYRGAFSAAKYAEQNVSKASSPFEFFIVQGKRGAHHLDNDHTVFGEVTRGMDVVDKIAKVKTDASEWPIRNILIDSVVVN